MHCHDCKRCAHKLKEYVNDDFKNKCGWIGAGMSTPLSLSQPYTLEYAKHRIRKKFWFSLLSDYEEWFSPFPLGYDGGQEGVENILANSL